MPVIAAGRTVYVMSGDEKNVEMSDSSQNGEALTPKNLLKRMSLEQKIAQMLMPSVRDEQGGGNHLTELTPAAKAAIEKFSFSGYLFFSQNCLSLEQMVRLTSSMQCAAVGSHSGLQIPLLLSIDQEGGRIERIGSGTMTPGNMALGASWDTIDAERTAEVIGSEMKSAGFNVDCAPVMDVNSNPANPVINLRSFGGDAEAAADMGAAFIHGLHQSGVIAMMKHFPGHGDTSTDSHTGLPRIDKTLEELEESELIPFQEGIDAGADMIMTAHIEFPQIEKDTWISRKNGRTIALPATLSDDILTGLLRDRMGYEGVIITDAIEMKAIKDHFDPIDAAELAINAGVDIILNPGDITTEKHVAELETYISRIAARVEDGAISEATIDEAVLRILNLKKKYGILEETNQWKKTTAEDIDQLVNNAENSVGSSRHQDAIWEITSRTTTLLKNDQQTLPIPISEAKTVILCPEQAAVSSAETAVKKMIREGHLNEGCDVKAFCYSGSSAAKASLQAAGAEYVIAVSASQSLSGIGTNESAVFLRSVMSSVQKKGGRFILISGGLPYEAAVFQDADAILVAYGYKTLTEIPQDQETESPDYGPNLPAAICAAFGCFVPSGSLPVEIPKMDYSYHPTEEIMYPLGYGLQKWDQESIEKDVAVEHIVPDPQQYDHNGEEETSRSVFSSIPLSCGLVVFLAFRFFLL